MIDHAKQKSSDLMAHTAAIVAAYVSRHAVEDLPALIRLVHKTLGAIENDANSGGAFAGSARQEPAVPVKKSVMPDYIVCLEDGKKLKMLKRYLKSAYNMTPEQYREKWNLPADYPMVAPNYAEKRSHLAKESGLGNNRRK